MSVFSTREIVTFICTVLFLLYTLHSKDVRQSMRRVIRVAFSRKLVQAACFLFFYASIIAFIFTTTRFWEWIYIKDIIIWVIFAGFPMCFNAVTINIDANYFKQMIKEHFRFFILVEFIMSSFTFSFLAEFFIVPITTFIAMLDVFAGARDDGKVVKKLTSTLLSLIGILLLVFTITAVIDNVNNIDISSMLVSFLIPIIYFLLFLPIVYLFAIYARYESLFTRMRFKESSNKKMKRWHRWEVIKACGLSYEKIAIFNQEYAVKMYVTMPQDSFKALISEFKSKGSQIGD